MSHPVASSSSTVELTIDGQTIKVPAGTTVFDAARMNGIEIPVLCHQQNGLLLADFQLADAHVVTGGLALSERLTELFFEAGFCLFKICVDHNGETDAHPDTVGEHLRKRKSGNGLA